VAERQRERILEATYACVARNGLRHTTMEDAAHEAGLSRATVYRYFPGGRDQLVDEVITWEVGRFFARLARHVGRPPDLATLVERGLMAAHDSLEHHEVLQQVLETEADRLLPQLATVMPIVHAVLRDYFQPWIEAAGVREGVEVEEAADYLARMALSFIGTQGRWDLSDPAAVRSLVRDRLLAGIVP
jgi:AcrR family transcriptional regulator